MTKPSRDPAQPLIRASCAGTGPGENLQALEIALAAARAEAASLRTQLHAIETSTFWRLTAPFRVSLDRLQRWRRRAAPGPQNRAAGPGDYAGWITTGEASCRAALVPRGPCQHDATPARLGLVITATPGAGPALRQLLASCPKAFTILLLDHDSGLPPGVTGHPQVMHHPVPPGFEAADAVALALACLDAGMVCFLDARDRLAPDALSLIAGAAAQTPPCDLIFADEDWLDADDSRVRPFFKPGWDPELQRGRDLVGPFAFFRTALLRGAAPAAGPAWLYDLTNQVAALTQPDRIRHIPAVLSHRVVPQDVLALRAAAAAQLRRDGVAASVEPAPDGNRVIYALPAPAPLVSVIVPTRDRAGLLRVCAESVLQGTDYRNLELLIVDNGSVEPDALALLDALAADKRVRVLRQPGAFNWSALNNAAAAQADGAILVLLNNDIAVLQPDWLTVLIAHALQPGVGAVGPKLLYPDGRVQHAGLTTDEAGIPLHIFRHLAGDAPGAFGLAGLARTVWGVTGACMAIPRTVFVDVGGLNEAFPVAYNDVEFCLRLAAHGYRIVWTPWSRLEHREMATRPSDAAPSRHYQRLAELDRLRRDWGGRMMRDPFLNANLQLIDEQPHFRKASKTVPNL